MRIAVHPGVTMRGTVEGVVAEVRKAADHGLAGYWPPMLTGHDTLTAFAVGDVAGAREHIHRMLGANDRFPSYQKVLRREGVDGVARLAIVGSPDEVARGLDAFAASGVTDFAAHPPAANEADADRTRKFLADRAGAS